MIKREELVRTKEYWFETIQNEIYRTVSEYIVKEGINQTQFAEKLGVSKGYVSQILNGNFNATLKKLIELSLAVNVVPSIDFKNIEEFVKEDQVRHYEMQYQQYFNFPALNNITTIFQLKTEHNLENAQPSDVLCSPIAA